jgi:NAD(P)-dependent dehydrogenase (short-subunit alcohol dehydrogenase family)
MNLKGKTLFITGASRGIGLAIGLRAARDGANVVIAAKTAEPHPKLPGTIYTAAAEIEAAGGRALPLVVDVRDEEAVKGALDKTAETFGGLDIVVNNAANALAQPVGSITPEALEKSHATNLRGPLFLVQEALPSLRASGRGVVINVISAGVFMHSGGLSLYASAKSGLLALTRSMAAELAPDGIRVNALAPGTVDTDMVRATDPAAQERMATVSLLRRMAAPEEMIGPALFLASDASSYVTGQVLVADGGLTFR